MTTATQQWFGQDFAKLHPLLQRLHTKGGVLSGEVIIQTGSGLGSVFGRKLTKKLGIPLDGQHHQLEVTITHKQGALHWNRRFDENATLCSVFTPIGQKGTDGFWNEKTGAVQLTLGVDIKEGGWHWKTQKMHYKGLPLPLWLMPKTSAYKRIEPNEDGQNCYRFHVVFSLPLLGTILSYGGLLDLKG